MAATRRTGLEVGDGEPRTLMDLLDTIIAEGGDLRAVATELNGVLATSPGRKLPRVEEIADRGARWLFWWLDEETVQVKERGLVSLVNVLVDMATPREEPVADVPDLSTTLGALIRWYPIELAEDVQGALLSSDLGVAAVAQIVLMGPSETELSIRKECPGRNNAFYSRALTELCTFLRNHGYALMPDLHGVQLGKEQAVQQLAEVLANNLPLLAAVREAVSRADAAVGAQ